MTWRTPFPELSGIVIQKYMIDMVAPVHDMEEPGR